MTTDLPMDRLSLFFIPAKETKRLDNASVRLFLSWRNPKSNDTVMINVLST